MDTFNDSLYDNEEDFCPLCCEEMDITDKNFKPCPCGYQICQFCYNNIRTNPELNGKCPACRRLYDDESVEYIKMTPDELKQYHARQERKKKEKKELEKQKRDAEQAKRHHLSNMRVIQKNLVYVLGLNPNVPYDDLPHVLRSEKYFGQFGKINKVVINRRATTGPGIHNPNTGYSVYVTFAKKEDATKCIETFDGAVLDDRVLKAAHGTTKYCSTYLRGQQCQNPNCMFLHEPGEEADSYNKQDSRNTPVQSSVLPVRSNTYNLPSDDQLTSKTNSPIISNTQLQGQSSSISLGGLSNTDTTESTALPATVSWATTTSNDNSSFPNLNNNNTNNNNHDSSSAFPTLSAFLQQQQQQQQFQPQIKHSSIPMQSKKKDKKDKDLDKKQIILDDSMASFKNLSDNLKNLNSNSDINYSLNPRFQLNPPFNLFHPSNLHSFNNRSCGYLNNDEGKSRIFKLVDSLLYTPSSKNYNYRSCLEARQSAQVQAQALAQFQAQTQAAQSVEIPRSAPVGGVSPAQLQARLLNQPQPQPQPQSQPQLQSQSNGNNNPNNRVVNALNTASFLQQRLQQQQLKAMAAASQGGGSILTNAPPGLYPTNVEPNKANTQELLSQLLK